MQTHVIRRHTGRHLAWLSGLLLILALSAHAASPIAPSHETLCGFTMRDTDAWQLVERARDVGLQRIPSSPAPRYYQNGATSMVVYCAPRFASTPDFEASVAREVSVVSHSYTDFSIIGSDRIDFQNALAEWFLFSGSLKRVSTSQRGYVIVADRGEHSLVIALSTQAMSDYEYGPLFRSAVQLFSLR